MAAHLPSPRTNVDELSEPPTTTRARVAGAGAARYIGNSALLAVGGELTASLPIDDWYAGLNVRYVTLVTEFGAPVPRLATWDLVVKGTFGHAFRVEPLRVDVGLNAGLGIIDMSSESNRDDGDDDDDNNNNSNDVEAAAVDARFGLAVVLSVPMSGVVSGVFGVDTELALGGLGDSTRRLDPALPPLPTYSAGLSLGLEVAVP